MAQHRAARREVRPRGPVTPGRRVAQREPVTDGPARDALLRRPLRALPGLVGVAVLAVAGTGAVHTTDGSLGAGLGAATADVASATSGQDVVTDLADRRAAVSRDSARQALEDAADAELVEAAEEQAAERNAELKSLARATEARAGELARNVWTLPTSNYRLTARFGMSGSMWSSNHTGLDFAAPSGTPIVSVAAGTVTETGWAGAYGNRTIITLEDGTEVWYCHQNSIDVQVGQQVGSGQTIGSVGSTGNSSGSHLHLEVRPGGGDPVDPYAALQARGVTP
jgi:murein DD-endopeptidase MepM/ murein hydrolase activator NlpD